MNPQDLSAITVYQDIITVLKERGYSDIEVTEIFAKLTAQAEMEVVEELIEKLTPEQLKVLDSMPDNVSASEIVQKLDIQGDLVDSIRAEKTARLIEEVIPSLNE